MNKQNIQAWTAALRSGNYLQGHERLQLHISGEADSRYCCLGVACEVSITSGLDLPHEVISNWAPSGVAATTVEYGEERTSSVLPEKVWDWLGLPDAGSGSGGNGDEWYPSYRFHENLISLNDTHSADFDTIADYIEECTGGEELVVVDLGEFLSRKQL